MTAAFAFDPVDVPPPVPRPRRLGSDAVTEILALTARPEVISFAGGMPGPDLFDVSGLSVAFQAVLDSEPRRVLQYSTSEGDPGLRAAIAARMRGRGLPTAAEDLLMTTGSQQAMSLTIAALLEPGDVVAVENPTYLTALHAFELAGVRTVAVPCDDEGLDPEALDAVVAREHPRLLYTVPTFQNPTGRTLPADRRAAIAGIAARRGLWIVEDDPYGDLSYEDVAPPWLATFPGAEDRTVLLGSLSKVLAPGLRIGWLRAPKALRNACLHIKQIVDVHSSTIDQAAAAWYIATADLDLHIALLCSAYRERRDALLEGLGSALPDARWRRPNGGMFVWVALPGDLDAETLLRRAARYDVAFVPGAPFYVSAPDRSTMRLSFATPRPAEIREGVRRLAMALRSG
jgi:2-aminoadipate transaminase